MWLKELNLFLNVTQRIEPLFEYDSENWIFVRYVRLKVKESNLLFFNTTQRIEHFFCMWFMFSNDSKNWIFIWLKEWYLTQRLEIYVFEIWFKELDLFFDDSQTCFFQKLWRKELNLFLYDSKNWTLFLYDAKNWTFFLICRQELSFFFFLNFDSNWALFF